MSTWLLQGWIHCLAQRKKRERRRQRSGVSSYFPFYHSSTCYKTNIFFKVSCWPPLLALYICLRWSQDEKNNHSNIIQQVSKVSLGKLPRSRSEELCFGWLKKNEFALMISTEPKSIAAGVQTLYKIIIDSHRVIVSTYHMIGPCTSGIILTCNYISFLVKCWILDILCTHKECKLWFCLCITESS